MHKQWHWQWRRKAPESDSDQNVFRKKGARHGTGLAAGRGLRRTMPLSRATRSCAPLPVVTSHGALDASAPMLVPSRTVPTRTAPGKRKAHWQPASRPSRRSAGVVTTIIMLQRLHWQARIRVRVRIRVVPRRHKRQPQLTRSIQTRSLSGQSPPPPPHPDVRSQAHNTPVTVTVAAAAGGLSESLAATLTRLRAESAVPTSVPHWHLKTVKVKFCGLGIVH